MEIICEKCKSKNVEANDAWDIVKINNGSNEIKIVRVYECNDCHRRSKISFIGNCKIENSELIIPPSHKKERA